MQIDDALGGSITGAAAPPAPVEPSMSPAAQPMKSTLPATPVSVAPLATASTKAARKPSPLAQAGVTYCCSLMGAF